MVFYLFYNFFQLNSINSNIILFVDILRCNIFIIIRTRKTNDSFLFPISSINIVYMKKHWQKIRLLIFFCIFASLRNKLCFRQNYPILVPEQWVEFVNLRVVFTTDVVAKNAHFSQQKLESSHYLHFLQRPLL